MKQAERERMNAQSLARTASSWRGPNPVDSYHPWPDCGRRFADLGADVATNGAARRKLRSLSFFLNPSLWLGLLGSSILVAPAHGQWTQNPLLVPDLPGGNNVLIPLHGSVAAVQVIDGTSVEVHGMNQNGYAGANDFPSPPFGTWSEPSMSMFRPTACSLDEDTFALAYVVNSSTIRVVFIHYDSSTNTFSNTVGPLTVGDGYDVAITPRLVPDPGDPNAPPIVDGVWCAFRSYPCIGPGCPNDIRQQGITSTGSLLFPTSTFPNGVFLNLEDSHVTDIPLNIIGSNDGLAIVTYGDWSPQLEVTMQNGLIYRTTKVDMSGNCIWDETVPGQVGYTPGDCLVVRDGAGGAFYCYANFFRYDDGTNFYYYSKLVVAQVTYPVSSCAGSSYSHIILPNPSDDPYSQVTLLRPLAAVPTPDGGVVLEFRTEQHVVTTTKCLGGPSLPIQWNTFLFGGTMDGSDAAAGMMGPTDTLGLVTTVTTANPSEVRFVELDHATGTLLAGPLQVNTAGNHHATRPQIVPWTRPSCGSGFIVSWYDNYAGVKGTFADRLNNGHLGLINACSWDDGSSEQLAGFGTGGELAWMQRFGSAGRRTYLDSVQVAWGSLAYPGRGPANGSPAKVLLWDDPNDDGDPADLVLLRIVNTTVQQVDTDTFVTIPITPVAAHGVYFVGASLVHSAFQYPVPLDESCPTAGVAWFFGDDTGAPVNYDNPQSNVYPPQTFDSAGIPAVLMIRAGCDSHPPMFPHVRRRRRP